MYTDFLITDKALSPLFDDFLTYTLHFNRLTEKVENAHQARSGLALIDLMNAAGEKLRSAVARSYPPEALKHIGPAAERILERHPGGEAHFLSRYQPS